MVNLTHNICIASYPRSGNTFLRHILYEVFGLFSWNDFERYKFICEIINNPNIRPNDSFIVNRKPCTVHELTPLLPQRIIKTHDLPENITEYLESTPFIIYIIRDGRDAIVSEAHHRSDIVVPGSSYLENMRKAIYAEGGSHFGGWSCNVRSWIKKADLIIHFEQLIAEPQKCIRKLTGAVSLPEPDFSKIPTFRSQRRGHHPFITNSKTEKNKGNYSKLFFRKGKAGAFVNEMPEEMQLLFLKNHNEMLEELGYVHNDPAKLKYYIH